MIFYQTNSIFVMPCNFAFLIKFVLGFPWLKVGLCFYDMAIKAVEK